MAVTYAEFIVFFPEFTTSDTTEQARIQRFLDGALRVTPLSVWCADQDYAISLLAAHRLTKADQVLNGSAIGGLTAISASQGSQSFSFAQAGQNEKDPEDLSSTIYGQELLVLRKGRRQIGFVSSEWPTQPNVC